MPHGLIGLVLAAVLQQAPGEPLLSALSLRELCWSAEVVVIAAVVDPKPLTRLRVRQVFAGRLKPGQEIQVDGLEPFFPADAELPANRVLEMCLFLNLDPDQPPGQPYQLVPTGLACLGRGGSIYRPIRWGQPGEFQLRPRGKSEDWAALLAQVERDLRDVQRLRSARALPVGRGRNQALLDWIERHRREFRIESALGRGPVLVHPVTPALVPGAAEAQREHGWGELERLPFLWVLDSGVLPDCWVAIQLYAEIHSGQCLGLDRATFNSGAGRAFLARMASDERHLEGARRRALRLLVSARTLRGKAPLDDADQNALLEQLGPLLGEASASLRGQAARTVLEVSRPCGGMSEPSRQLLAELVKVYHAEKPGETREALAEAVRVIGGDKEWQTLTGQALGLAGAIQDLQARGDRVQFWLLLRGRDIQVAEAPTLVLERVDAMGKVLQKKTEPLTALRPDWPTVWDGATPLFLGLGVQALEPGSWRLWVEGVSGKERQRWQSEPRLFKVTALDKPEVKGGRRIAEVPGEE